MSLRVHPVKRSRCSIRPTARSTARRRSSRCPMKSSTFELTSDSLLFDYLLRLADSDLILAQHLGEWVGHGPVLEEDIALTNVGLDLLGQARMWFGYAREVEAR